MRKLLFFISALAFLTSCNNEITDEITNPADINIIYELVKGTDENANITQYIRALVFSDTYSMYDKIENGGITYNGLDLPFNEQTKTYYTETDIMKDSLYTFHLTLSNGKTFVSSVRSPAAMFGTVVTNPVVYSTGGDLSIQWSDISENATINIELWGKPFNRDENISIFETETDDDGTFVINKSDLPTQYQDVVLENAFIRLLRINNGTKCDAFNSEEISVVFSYNASLETE